MRLLLFALLLGAGCRYRAEIDGPDADGDGYGALVDCNDEDASVSPGATEIPNNGVDDDCDPATPDTDLDGDGTAAPEDCDDANPAVHPGATEVCDGLDDDCNGTVDDALDGTWYTDADGDGYGADGTATTTCSPGANQVAVGGDCNDARDDVNPAAQEICDAVDHDCDGFTDRNVPDTLPGVKVYYADGDGDGYGDPGTATTACTQPTGYVLQAGDCDDDATSGPDIHPGAAEVCDGVDQDCDGVIDEGAGSRILFYLDADADGHGDPATSILACAAPEHYVASRDDCDDLDANTYPGATEICDGKSNGCTDEVDQGVADAPLWYPDADGDGYGDPNGTPAQACTVPEGYVANTLDCDDNATNGADAHPGGVEVCDDGLDNDCDGTVDNAFDAHPFYRDEDGDGYGDPNQVGWGCTAPEGYVADASDCVDDPAGTSGIAGSAIHPGATEQCNGVDEDCNGVTDDGVASAPTWYLDTDGDGYGDDTHTVQACSKPAGAWADTGGDCGLADATVHPNADKQCDGVDHDCDGHVDFDADGDGFVGDSSACPDAPDCDDTPGSGATIYPGKGGCSGGESCLAIADTWGYVDDGSYWIDGENAADAPREVTCDMTDDDNGPGRGWTLVYQQDFDSGSDGWMKDTASTDPVAAPTSTCSSGATILGEMKAGNPIWVYKTIPTSTVPHLDAWVELTYWQIDDWRGVDRAFVEFDWYQDLWQLDGYTAADDSTTELCGDTGTDKNDTTRDVTVAYRTYGADLDLIVGSQQDSTNEGFGVDDVQVWVR